MLRPNFFPASRRTVEPRSCTRGGSRITPRITWEEEGVASTVGTIMALMVFLAFLSMFTSQYVPVWMEENEASHMSEAYGQFAALKQAVDLQILAGTISGTSTVQMFSPIKMGAKGIPMFATDTPGYLSISRSASYDNVTFSFNTTGSIQDYSMYAGGTIKLKAANRYYIPQELAFENDALVLKQSDGQYMKAIPQFVVTPTGGMTANGSVICHISYTQVDMRGDDINYIGYGTRGITTVMKSTTTTTYTNITNGSTFHHLSIIHTTYYERAWFDTLNQTLTSGGLKYGIDYTIVSTLKSPADLADKMYEIIVQINPEVISSFSHTVAHIEVSTSEMGVS